MEIKRTLLKERFKVVLTLFNCIMLSVFVLLNELDILFLVVAMVLIALNRIRIHIKLLKNSPKQMSYDEHMISVDHKKIRVNDINTVSLHILNKKSMVLVIKTDNDEFHITKKLYKNFNQLCNDLENMSYDQYDYRLYKCKFKLIESYSPYLEQMVWQDYVTRKTKLKELVWYLIFFLFGLIFFTLGVITTEGNMLDTFITAGKFFMLYTVYLSIGVIYVLSGYSRTASLLKAIVLLITPFITVFSLILCFYYLFA